jgi:protein-S-isoprenylcysteine O-methyltransferase Ste14
LSKGKIIYNIVALVETLVLLFLVGVFLKQYFVNNMGLTIEQSQKVTFIIFVVCILVCVAISILQLIKKHYIKD